MKAFRVLALLAASLLAAAPAQSQVEGQQFERITPAQRPGTPGKVEVIEFFSYACPHCFALSPLIDSWKEKLPNNAVLVRVPVSFGRPQWGALSRAYYALMATGDLNRLDAALFRAIHVDKQPLFDEDNIVAWVAKQGVDAKKFRAAYNGFDVSRKATRAEQLSRDYRVRGVPQIAVDGKYTALGRNHEEMLQNTSLLIDKVAGEKQTANR